MGKVLFPALRDAYLEYLEGSDIIADGPTHRFLALALTEKVEQIVAFERWADLAMSHDSEWRAGALSWSRAVADRLSDLGGVGGWAGAFGFHRVGTFARGQDFCRSRSPRQGFAVVRAPILWPDVVDPTYPYGEGLQLQIRSAMSHLNEVWAIETGGIILNSFTMSAGMGLQLAR